jgi:protein transport protein SEC23
MFATFLEELHSESKPINAKNRPIRCSGMALQVTTDLIRSLPNQKFKARINLFLGGAATVGPGNVTTLFLKDTIRTYADLNKCQKLHFLYRNAIVFFNTISEKIARPEVIFDCFACSPEQVGIAEMKLLVNNSGGNLFYSDSFQRETFKLSSKTFLQQIFTNNFVLDNIKLICSKKVQIIGLMGPTSRARLHERELNQINPISTTNKTLESSSNSNCYYWKMPHSCISDTLCLLYEIIGKSSSKSLVLIELSDEQETVRQPLTQHVQIIARYRNKDCELKFRVATMKFKLVDRVEPNQIIDSFHSKIASVILGRLIAHLG